MLTNLSMLSNNLKPIRKSLQISDFISGLYVLES